MIEELHEASGILSQIKAMLHLAREASIGHDLPHIADGLEGVSTLAGLLSDKLEAVIANRQRPGEPVR